MIAEFRRQFAREAAYLNSVQRPLPDSSYLAISGGGDNGAFGVTYGGTTYQELHVDGGAIAQTFLYPPSIAVSRLAGIGPKRSRTAYIVRNGRLRIDPAQTERRTLSIATRAVSTLTTSSGVGDLYRIYTTTKRDGVGFRLAFITDDFAEPHESEFDRTYMNRLFEYARAKAKSGYPWRRAPPGLVE
jgi:hypothetical protein